MEKMIFNIAMRKSKSFLIGKYSAEWFNSFQALSRQHFQEILPQIPNIGSSIFRSVSTPTIGKLTIVMLMTIVLKSTSKPAASKSWRRIWE
ncbi:MAG: hypothetical protein H6Q64_2271 [Firmicutes bacterium]|nr:hypothetical protein [Bacillota bacterium]